LHGSDESFQKFKRICPKIWNPSEFESLHIEVAITLALVEMHFPPSFFDIMTHLLYHLVDEMDLCGLVASRWMYPMEWYMRTLKTCADRIWQDSRHPWPRVTFVMNALVLSLNICKVLKLCNDVYGMWMTKKVMLVRW